MRGRHPLVPVAVAVAVLATLGSVSLDGTATRVPHAAAVVLPVASGATTPSSTVSAEGDLMAFGPAGAGVAGQVVRVLEQPALAATTDDSGHWRIDGLVPGETATFAVDSGPRYPIQTATFVVPVGGLHHVTFQSPTRNLVSLFERMLGVSSDPTRCHLATTVTRQGYSLYLGAPDGTHGEPGATVTIEPAPDAGEGPIYFNGRSFDVIWPDRRLSATTADGGVLFVNVTPGVYTLHAQKDGAAISSVTVGCRAGVLTNASPPWGLQVTSGGLGPDETVPFGPTSSTTSTASTASTTSTSPTSPTATSMPVSTPVSVSVSSTATTSARVDAGSSTRADPVRAEPRLVG